MIVIIVVIVIVVVVVVIIILIIIVVVVVLLFFHQTFARMTHSVFNSVLERIGSNYECIVIDCPPVMGRTGKIIFCTPPPPRGDF